MLLEM
jgi:hypothetical protein